VYKVVQWYDPGRESSSILLDVFDVTPGEPIRLMEISRQVRVMTRLWLHVLLNVAVRQNTV
jgi:hypothetical protein